MQVLFYNSHCYTGQLLYSYNIIVYIYLSFFDCVTNAFRFLFILACGQRAWNILYFYHIYSCIYTTINRSVAIVKKNFISISTYRNKWVTRTHMYCSIYISFIYAWSRRFSVRSSSVHYRGVSFPGIPNIIKINRLYGWGISGLLCDPS